MSTNLADKRADATTLSLSSKFTFGRYKRTDKSVGDVVIDDPEYLVWVNTNVDFIIIPVEILSMCYDAQQLLKWPIDMQLLRELVEFQDGQVSSLQGETRAEKILNLLRYLVQELTKKHEAKITLDE